jgi:hypothetical protein
MLAATVPAATDGRPDLQIGNPAPNAARPSLPGQPTGGAGTGTSAVPSDGPTWAGLSTRTGTTLPPAEPNPSPAAPGGVPAPTRDFGVASYDQAKSQLIGHGATWWRLEALGDQGLYKFSCSIPNPQSRNISRTYEAQAPNDLAAMQAVLDQIDKDKR